ncbi:MAG: IPTL-CTERM sorting domain-containing protein [Pseudomonadota bacterium]
MNISGWITKHVRNALKIKSSQINSFTTRNHPTRPHRSINFLIIAALLGLCQLSSVAQAQDADLAVTKSGPGTAAPGADVAYNVIVTNSGPDSAANITLNDPIPAGMTFVSATQNSGPAFNCTTPAVGTDGVISCTVASMASGASADFTFTLNIPVATASGINFTNIASVSNDTFDPNEENNTASANTNTPANFADLGLTKSGPDSGLPDSDITYTINLVNGGPAAAQTVELTDALPGDMTFVSLNSTGGFSCTTPAVGAGGTVSCTIATLASGANASFTLIGHVPSGTVSETTYTNTAAVTSAQDPSDENDSASVTTTISSADLSISVSGPASVNAGAALSYALTVTNAGPDAVNPATTVVNTLPTGATNASGSGSGWSCSAPASGTITCSSNAMTASGASFPVLTIAMTAPAVPGNAQNSALVPSLTDPNPGNNTGSASTNVIAQADVAITKNGPTAAVSGQNIAYTIVVTNNGPSPADGVIVTDPTPAGANFVSNSGACSGVFPCNLGTLNAGQSATITSTFSTAGAFSGTVTNTATVSSTTADTNSANDSATASTNIAAGVDLSITKSASAGPYLAGAPITYTIVVSNAGPGSANGVTMTDVIPAGTSFVSATPSQGSCSGTSTVSCSLGTLTDGGSATIIIQLTLPSGGGSVSNTASVTSSSPDVNGANDAATAALAVVPPVLAAIPSLSEMGLLLAAVLLALSGMWMQRQRRG